MTRETPDGLRALVTGASGGIGRAIAIDLARTGASVILHYSSGRERAEKTLALIDEIGGHACLASADLRDVDALPDFMAGCGQFDVLVNNSGIARGHALESTTTADFDQVFDTNVKGTFFLTQAALPFIRDGGSIINVSSMVSLRAYPSTIAYAMTKAAINAFTRCLAADLAPRGINVNAIAPGATDSGFLDSIKGRPDVMEAIVEQTAMGRLGKPADIAGVVQFLASPAAAWITGQVIEASGGMHL